MRSKCSVSVACALLEPDSEFLRTHFGLDLHRRNCGGQVAHAHQIVGGAGEGENPIYFAHSAMANFPHQRNRFQPAEAFFDPLALSLAHHVTCVSRGATIDCTAATSFVVLLLMRPHP